VQLHSPHRQLASVLRGQSREELPVGVLPEIVLPLKQVVIAVVAFEALDDPLCAGLRERACARDLRVCTASN
jgi:hypothetical protein